jgi:hypothetical protein
MRKTFWNWSLLRLLFRIRGYSKQNTMQLLESRLWIRSHSHRFVMWICDRLWPARISRKPFGKQALVFSEIRRLCLGAAFQDRSFLLWLHRLHGTIFLP